MHIFSDLHGADWQEFRKPWRYGLGTRVRDTLRVLRTIFDMSDDTLLFLGDWFEHWDRINSPVRNIFTRRLYRHLDRHPNLRLIMLAGNHDLYDKRDSTANTIFDYSAHPQITVVEEPTILELEGHPCALIPYSEDYAEIVKVSDRLYRKGARYIFSHLDLIGAESRLNGWISDQGLPVSRFQRYTGGVFGHFHQHQTFSPSPERPNQFSYVGNPLCNGLEDVGSVKGMVHLDLDTNVQTFIPIKAPRTVKVRSTVDPSSLRPDDLHYVTCEEHDVRGTSSHYRELGLQAKMIPMPRKIKVVTKAIITTDPIRQYAEKQKDLHLETLIEWGRHYVR